MWVYISVFRNICVIDWNSLNKQCLWINVKSEVIYIFTRMSWKKIVLYVTVTILNDITLCGIKAKPGRTASMSIWENQKHWASIANSVISYWHFMCLWWQFECVCQMHSLPFVCLPVAVIVELIVRRQSDEASPSSRQREEDLSGSVFPHLSGEERKSCRKNAYCCL